jgi:hypothetical protein
LLSLENLERISLDQNYIENLVFRLNHGQNTPRRSGFELTKLCSKFSPEGIFSTLKSFLSILAKKKEMERNFLAKNFFEKIIYSKKKCQNFLDAALSLILLLLDYVALVFSVDY